MQACSFPNTRPFIKILLEASEALTATQMAMRLALEALAHEAVEAEGRSTETQPAETPPSRGPPPVKTGPLTTAELAAALGRAQSTIRRRLCDTGSYFGVVPIKLATGRLLWPADSLKQLTRSGGAK